MSKPENTAGDKPALPISQIGQSVKDIAGVLANHMAPQVIQVPHPENSSETLPVIAVPQGNGLLKIEHLKGIQDAHRSKPERRSGTAKLLDLDSFIAHANRFKNDHSALFAINDMMKPSILSVLDYHLPGPVGEPRFGKHRGLYEFPLSKQWNLWLSKQGPSPENIMDGGAFAAFLEDNIVDVIEAPDFANNAGAEQTTAQKEADKKLADLIQLAGGLIAGPSKLMELSRNLAINVESKTRQAQSLSTGEIHLQYEEVHEAKDGEGKPVKVPNFFLIGIPIFEGGAPYRLVVRLRYRPMQGKVLWFYQIHRPDLAFEHAFKEAVEVAKAKTELPLMLGTPE